MGKLFGVLGMVMLCGFSVGAQEVASGLKPGDQTPAFPIVDVTGPHKGQTLCYI